MISITSTQLDAWLAAFIFPLARILAMVASSPVLGNKQTPVRIKIGLSVLLTIVIAPSIANMPQVAVGSPQGLLIMIQQIIIGVAMGFTISMIFNAVEMAGDDEILVTFDEPQRAITPGQAAVFYDDNLVVGGGWIV